MDILAQLLRGKKSTAKIDEHVHEAVSLNNKLFYDTVVARYGSWEVFVESQRRRSDKKS